MLTPLENEKRSLIVNSRVRIWRALRPSRSRDAVGEVGRIVPINNINVAEKKRPKKDEKVGQPLVSHLSAKVGE